jgi:hypothetical protein
MFESRVTSNGAGPVDGGAAVAGGEVVTTVGRAVDHVVVARLVLEGATVVLVVV